MKVVKYAAILIGTYLALGHATQGGQLIGSGKSFIQGVTQTFQGR